MVPGSISDQAKEIFQEGLRLPGIKVVERDEPIRPVLEIMKVNSRLPDFLEGDMWAGIAAARLGERRIAELVAKYGRETFLAALALFMDYGEQVSLRALERLPQGPVFAGGGAGRRPRLQRRSSRSATTPSWSTCATTPTRIRSRRTSATTRR